MSLGVIIFVILIVFTCFLLCLKQKSRRKILGGGSNGKIER